MARDARGRRRPAVVTRCRAQLLCCMLPTCPLPLPSPSCPACTSANGSPCTPLPPCHYLSPFMRPPSSLPTLSYCSPLLPLQPLPSTSSSRCDHSLSDGEAAERASMPSSSGIGQQRQNASPSKHRVSSCASRLHNKLMSCSRLSRWLPSCGGETSVQRGRGWWQAGRRRGSRSRHRPAAQSGSSVRASPAAPSRLCVALMHSKGMHTHRQHFEVERAAAALQLL